MGRFHCLNGRLQAGWRVVAGLMEATSSLLQNYSLFKTIFFELLPLIVTDFNVEGCGDETKLLHGMADQVSYSKDLSNFGVVY